MADAWTLMCPVDSLPLAPPRIRTSRSPRRRSRRGTADPAGSFHRSARRNPAIRIFGPSAHQIGPSPSHTAVGVHVNVRSAETTGAAASDLGGRKLDRMTHSKTLAANLPTAARSIIVAAPMHARRERRRSTRDSRAIAQRWTRSRWHRMRAVLGRLGRQLTYDKSDKMSWALMAAFDPLRILEIALI
jgi:hypothetical protein